MVCLVVEKMEGNFELIHFVRQEKKTGRLSYGFVVLRV